MHVFHGATTGVANCVCAFVIPVVPHLHAVHHTLSNSPGQGLDMVCRVLFEAQQEHFHWVNQTADSLAAVDPVDFSKILGLVQTTCVQSLCHLPSALSLAQHG